MAIPSEVYSLFKEFDKEYGENWERIPETDERLLKVRLLLIPKTNTKRNNRTNRGNQKIVWTEEMDNYLTENDGKTLAELSRILDVSASAISKRRSHMGMKNRGNQQIVWTDEMDEYLTENDGKTLAELSRILDVSATAISKRRDRLGIKNVSRTEANGGIIYTDKDGNEHVYASVTLARIATKLPRKTIYKALKIGKEWRYA